ncbi:MAG TPA: hypothetical protein VF547_10550, partial [Allosphingosinicella sp.]
MADIVTRNSLGLSDGTYNAWQEKGFYASAYDVDGAGIDGLVGTVISYRGTNFNFSWLNFFNSPLWQDIRSGWSVGAGVAGAQATMALDFYHAVKGDGVDPRDAEITTTGHSLGGGLAGLAANLYGREAILFDHMTYGPISSTITRQAESSQQVRDRYFEGQYPWELDPSGISAFFTEGEILRLERALFGETSSPLPSHSSGQSAVTLHSMALLTSLIWAEQNADPRWKTAGALLWNSFFDEALGTSQALPGVESRAGPGGTGPAVMNSAIAYSALDAGERPFGDTAIWSMFDDAAQLGSVLGSTGGPDFLGKIVDTKFSFGLGGLDIDRVTVRQHLANLLVQYAGALALYDVEQEQGGTVPTSRGPVDAREGILSRETIQSALAVDLSRTLWGDVLKSNPNAVTKLPGDRLEPLDRDAFRQTYFKQAEEQGILAGVLRFLGVKSSKWDDDDLREITRQLWGTDDLSILDRFHMAPVNQPTHVILDNRGYVSDTSEGSDAQVDVYIGTTANETIDNRTTGHNLIITGEGADDADGG